MAATHHERVTRLSSRTSVAVAVLTVLLGAVHCKSTTGGPTGADAGGALGQDGGADAQTDAPSDAHHDGAMPPADTGSDSPQDAVSLDCLSNSWGGCTFMSDCSGCCVDGTCRSTGSSPANASSATAGGSR